MERGRVAMVGLVLAAAVAGGVLYGARQRPSAPPLPPQLSQSEPRAETVTVHVSGWVRHPGLVAIPADARVADAIAAAGGARAGADLSLLNLAAPVGDGSQVQVPGPDGGDGGPPASPADGLVHVNQATAAQLEELPGVGPVLAERIVAFREANGPFEQIEDLLEVPGIGEAKLAGLRDRVAIP
jgi:competence protein ComEA